MTVEELKIVISAQVQGLRSNLADAKARLRGVASEADNTKASIDSMSDANLAGLKQQFNDAKAKVSELTNKIKEADAELKKLTKEYNSYFVNVSPASRTGFENALGNNAEFQKLKENIESVKTNLAAWNAELPVAQENVSRLKEELDNAEKSTRKLGTSAKTVNKAFNSLSNIFKRMIIRKAISAILSEISDCIGLLARFDKLQDNLHGYNRALSSLKSEFKQLAADITVALMNLLNTIQPLLTPLINAVQWLVEGFSRLFAILSGKSTYTRANPDYWKDYADALEDSDKTAKNLYTTIAGFDELNVLNDKGSVTNAATTTPGELFEEVPAKWDTATTAAAALGIAGLAKGIVDLVSKVKSLTSGFKNKNSVLTTQNGLEKTSLATIGEIALALAGATAAVWSFADMWQKGWSLSGEIIKDLGISAGALAAYLAGLVSGPVAAGIAAAVALVSSLAIVVHDNWDSIKKWSIETWNTVSTKVSNWATETATTINEWISTTWSNFQAWKKNVYTTIGEWSVDTWNTVSTWAANTINKVSEWSATTWDKINTWATNTGNRISVWATTTWGTVRDWARNVGDKIDAWAVENVTRILQWATDFNNNMKNAFTSAFSKVKEWCLNAGTALINWASNAVTNISAGMKSIVENIGNGLETAFSNIKEWSASALESISSWASSAAQAVGNWASSIVNSIGTALSNAWSSVKSFFSSVASAFNSGEANGSPSIIDRLKTTAGLLAATVATTGAMFVKKLFSGVSSPSFVPAFANGGVISSPTLGLMGEYAGASSNPEIVAPQNMIKGIIDSSNGELANVYMQVGRQIISAIENKDLNVSIGDNEIAQAAARGNQSYYRRTGRNLIGA